MTPEAGHGRTIGRGIGELEAFARSAMRKCLRKRVNSSSYATSWDANDSGTVDFDLISGRGMHELVSFGDRLEALRPKQSHRLARIRTRGGSR